MDEDEESTEQIETEDENLEAVQELPKLSGSITSMTMCPIYPLLALTSDTGLVSIFNWITKEVLCTYSYSLSATTVIWPNQKLEHVGASLIVGFGDGTLRWFHLVKEDEKQIQEQNLNFPEQENVVMNEEREESIKEENETEVFDNTPQEEIDLNVYKKQEISSSEQLIDEKSVNDIKQVDINEDGQYQDNQQEHEHIAPDEKEEDEVYSLKLQAVTKPHRNEVCCLGVNEDLLLLVSQGLDSKLFFFKLKDFDFIPLGFYINNHLVNDFGWLNYGSDCGNNQDTKHLLIFCKHSYILEVDIPNIVSDVTDDSRLAYCIENFNCQVYKITGLLKYHELGDKISDINLYEISDVGRDVLLNLKYKEKKEKRETKERDLGVSGPPVSPKILCHLPSKFPGRMWLSLGKNDSGYLFEFQFIKEYQDQPIDFTPCRAVEIITANAVSIISMNFSFCGKYLYMGLEDGTLHYCCLEEPFEPSSSYDFTKLEAPDSAISIVEDAYASSDGSLLTRSGADSDRVEFKLNMVGHKDIIEYGPLPSYTSEDSKEIKDINGEDLPSLEESLQTALSKMYNQKRENIIEKLEEIKTRYLSFKEEYNTYLKECCSGLKYLEDIPNDLQLNTEIVSCCPKAVKLFKDKTKALQKELDKKYERDLVKMTLNKQKHLECFKSKVIREKYFVEESSQKVQSYRECIMPTFTRSIPLKYQQVYGKKVDNTGDSQELSASKPDKDKKHKKNDKLRQKLMLMLKDIIEHPEDGPASDIVLKYNKRKQELAERLEQRISTEEALENITYEENMCKNTMEEIHKFLYKFKDTAGYDYVFPTIKCIYPEKKEKTLAYLNMLHNFQDFFNSCITDVHNLKNTIHHHDITVKKKLIVPTGEPLDLKKIHISIDGDKNLQVEKRHIKIYWNAKNKQEPFKLDKCRKSVDFRIHRTENMFTNFHRLLRAVKPKIDCEKKFIEIRFLMQCIELNLWKATLSEEKLYVKILGELQEMLSVEEKDLFSSEKEMVSLKNLRQEEKQKWMNLYNDLIKIIGRNHKYKGYFKQIFKKKIYPNEEKRSQNRHSSSESSESEQNIDSDDDNQSVDLSVIDEELLKKIMLLRLKRQDVEQIMKENKRKIHSVSVKQNATKRKIQKISDAMSEIYEKLNIILDSRKQMYDTLTWPLVLYPSNIHSDYIYSPNSYPRKEKQLLDHEMSRIYEIVNEKLKAVNNYVRVSLLKLTSKVVTMEIQDMIDTASIFFPLIQSISISTDEYFESIKHTEMLSSLKSDSEASKEETTFIEDILATVTDPMPPSETSLQTDSEKQSDSSSKKTSNGNSVGSSSVTSEKNSEELFNLEELKGEDYKIKEKEDLHSWHEVCNEDDFLGLIDESFLLSENIGSIVSCAIPQKAGEKISMNSTSDDVDYYRRPFTYHTIENMKKTCYIDPACTSDSEINVEPDAINSDHKNGPEPDYPSFPLGGLMLNISVLRDMEKSDLDSYPYTSFYQEIEFHEELTAVPAAVHIEPDRTSNMDILYNFIPVSFSGFILVNTTDIAQILKFYSHVKASSKDLEQELKTLQDKVMTMKRALNFKHQDLMKERRELYGAMKSTFNHVIDLDLLQDTIENPHFHIKKAEFKTELDKMKNKLKKMKESEALAQRALDQLRFEDTQICYELLELRKEFKFLDESYSKCQVLPRIGMITKPEDNSQSTENL